MAKVLGASLAASSLGDGDNTRGQRSDGPEMASEAKTMARSGF
jgi:hypothetical protein